MAEVSKGWGNDTNYRDAERVLEAAGYDWKTAAMSTFLWQWQVPSKAIDLEEYSCMA